MCSDGSIKNILSGKPCNSCWRIQEILAECVNRLFEDAFCQLNVPKSLENKLKMVTEDIESILDSNEFKMYIKNSCIVEINA